MARLLLVLFLICVSFPNQAFSKVFGPDFPFKISIQPRSFAGGFFLDSGQAAQFSKKYIDLNGTALEVADSFKAQTFFGVTDATPKETARFGDDTLFFAVVHLQRAADEFCQHFTEALLKKSAPGNQVKVETLQDNGQKVYVLSREKGKVFVFKPVGKYLLVSQSLESLNYIFSNKDFSEEWKRLLAIPRKHQEAFGYGSVIVKPDAAVKASPSPLKSRFVAAVEVYPTTDGFESSFRLVEPAVPRFSKPFRRQQHLKEVSLAADIYPRSGEVFSSLAENATKVKREVSSFPSEIFLEVSADLPFSYHALVKDAPFSRKDVEGFLASKGDQLAFVKDGSCYKFTVKNPLIRSFLDPTGKLCMNGKDFEVFSAMVPSTLTESIFSGWSGALVVYFDVNSIKKIAKSFLPPSSGDDEISKVFRALKDFYIYSPTPSEISFGEDLNPLRQTFSPAPPVE